MFLANYPDYYIHSEFELAELQNLYFEYDTIGWSCVDRDENMNLIRKYSSTLESFMDKKFYHNDLCFDGDFSTQFEPNDPYDYVFGQVPKCGLWV